MYRASVDEFVIPGGVINVPACEIDMRELCVGWNA